MGAALIAPSQLPPFARRGCRPARRSRVPQCPSTIAHPAQRPSSTLQNLLPAVYRSDPGIIARHPTMHLEHLEHCPEARSARQKIKALQQMQHTLVHAGLTSRRFLKAGVDYLEILCTEYHFLLKILASIGFRGQ